MDLISHNPYRIAGVYSNATTKEIQKNKSKITSYANIGKDLSFSTDFEFLKILKRDTLTSDKAFAQLQQNQDKLKYSLFWFINSGPFDSTALEYLEKGNKEKAIDIWKKVIEGKEITAKNFSYFNNLGTLNLTSSFLSEIQSGIEAKVKLLESGNFHLFAKLVTDETYLINQKLQTEQFIDEILHQFKSKYKGAEATTLFKNCNGTTHKYLAEKLSAEPLHHIVSKIEVTKRKRKLDKKESYQFGHKLYIETQTHISELKKILGINDLRYKNAADSLSKEILQCGINYFQEYKDIGNPSQKSLELIGYAGTIGVGSQVKERIQDNKKNIEDWAETAPVKNELNFITKELAEFQDKPDTPSNARQLILTCAPKLNTMQGILGQHDEFYLKVSTAVANNAQGMLISAVNDEQEIFGYAANPSSADSEKLVGIAVKRSNGSQVTAQRILAEIIAVTKYTAINNLKTVVTDSLGVSIKIGTLEMTPEAKTRYTSNHASLRSLASQLNISTGPSRPSPRP